MHATDGHLLFKIHSGRHFVQELEGEVRIDHALCIFFLSFYISNQAEYQANTRHRRTCSQASPAGGSLRMIQLSGLTRNNAATSRMLLSCATRRSTLGTCTKVYPRQLCGHGSLE